MMRFIFRVVIATDHLNVQNNVHTHVQADLSVCVIMGLLQLLNTYKKIQQLHNIEDKNDKGATHT